VDPVNDIQFFVHFYFIIAAQRLCELIIAKRNEKWMMQQGAVEFGQKGYKLIVCMHVLFFFSLFAEKIIEDRGISVIWPWLGLIFIVSQLVRFWAIQSLGKYWNTKIIVLPKAPLVSRGPYRYIRHPNYLVVFLEMLTIPLIFNAYFTTSVFTVLNIVLLAVRIAEEETALKTFTEYEGIFARRNRFIPSILNRYDNS
jgi:methyltransferase